MLQTVLLKTIIEKAEKIKNEVGSEYLYASHVAVAAVDFCKTKYTGFAVSDFNLPRFEEERLRYIFSKEIRLSSYLGLRLSQNARKGVKEEKFELAECERIATERGCGMLSADIVFLCALKDLHASYKLVLTSISSKESMLALLEDTDKNIYDYVMVKIDGICSELRKKSDEAAAIRDWKPAAKFVEPDELANIFFGKIEKKSSDNVITLKIPKFFGNADLKVSIHKSDEIYYVHDNGCAIKHLTKKLGDIQKRDRTIRKVCAPCWISNGK